MIKVFFIGKSDKQKTYCNDEKKYDKFNSIRSAARDHSVMTDSRAVFASASRRARPAGRAGPGRKTAPIRLRKGRFFWQIIKETTAGCIQDQLYWTSCPGGPSRQSAGGLAETCCTSSSTTWATRISAATGRGSRLPISTRWPKTGSGTAISTSTPCAPPQGRACSPAATTTTSGMGAYLRRRYGLPRIQGAVDKKIRI